MNYVTQFLRKIKILKPHVVPNHVDVNCLGKKVKSVKYIGKSDVYCLDMPSTKCFLANGIVVHNCKDAERYFLFSHFGSKIGSSMSEQEAIEMERKYRYNYKDVGI